MAGESNQQAPAQGQQQPQPSAAAAAVPVPGIQGSPSVTAPAPAPSPSVSPHVAGAAPHEGVQSGGHQQGVGGFREALRQRGVNVDQWDDDFSALDALMGQLQQAQQLAQYGHQYIQHAGEFQRFLQEQQARQQAQQGAPKWWNPPEFRPEWRNLVTRDPQTGDPKLVQGAPPDILPKYLAYEQYRRDFADRFLTNPEETLQPFVQQQAQAIAQEMVNHHLQGYQDRVYADSFVQQNSSWLHQRDANGNVFADPVSGSPRLTAEGERFRMYVQEAERAGIRDIRAMEKFALGMLQRDMAFARLQQQTAGTTQQQTNQLLLQQQNRHQPNLGGSLNQAGVNGSGTSQNSALSLADRLRRDFQANGVTDRDFQNVA